jgi:hypothetical protein
MAANPNPARITAEFWYLWEELHKLEPSSQLGGIYTAKPGYHGTRAENQAKWPGNYSIVDKEDLGGPSDKAAAIDWTFPDAQAGHYATIDKYSSRLLASGKDPNDSRLDGWREFFGQADSDTGVEGWDFRYVEASSSDSSHLWHIHLSCDRDKVTSKANMDKLLEVLRGDDMTISDADADKVAEKTLTFDGMIDTPVWHPGHSTNPKITISTAVEISMDEAHGANVKAEQALAAIAELKALLTGGVTVPAVVNVSPESVAAIADATADEIHADPERDGV